MGTRTEAVTVLRPDGAITGERVVAVEAPVAIEVDGLGYAVMMMTPDSLHAFTTGFLLTERLVDRAADIVDLDAFESPAGWIVRATLAPHCRGRVHDRVRHRSSDTSCGLCGIAGLEQVHRPVAAPAPRASTSPTALFAALASLRDHQPLGAATGATHAAAACAIDGTIAAACEDVGRHNALDKLVGTLAMGARAIEGFILVSSRISFEMVDKALVARAPMLVGISAPTTLAVDHARAHGLTLAALARRDSMLILNDPWGLFSPIA
ncbi:formate dehydrogenase family accessory protein FdhD [Sphingomonas sp. Leaf17]|nr:formate dehydrogenase family accessory protein FdhD [Sphingomonas sp. Leaf17]